MINIGRSRSYIQGLAPSREGDSNCIFRREICGNMKFSSLLGKIDNPPSACSLAKTPSFAYIYIELR